MQRLADNFHGLVDAHAEERTLADMPWVQRLQHTYVENSARILAGTRDLLAEPLTDRAAALARARRLAAEVEQLGHDAARLRAQAAETTASPAAPHYGEQHLDAGAVATRAERVAESLRARLVAEADVVQDRITELRGEQSDADERARRHEATVEEEFEMAATVVLRMRDYYMRRVATYARRLSRRGRLDGAYELAVPPWAVKPCPWLRSNDQ